MTAKTTKTDCVRVPLQARKPPEVKVPRTQTGTLQLIQLYVISGHTYWVGGFVPTDRWEGFLLKMAARYRLDRSERMRVYDRQHEKASVHLVAVLNEDKRKVRWMLLSTAGAGGLLDKAVSPTEQPGDALKADGRLVWADYELVYANKKWTETQMVKGNARKVVKQDSTWTWRITPEAARGVGAAIKEACASMDPLAVRNVLKYQVMRPLFAGVRQQVVEFGQHACVEWLPFHKRWLKAQSEHFQQGYKDIEKLLKPPKREALPFMTRMKVYHDVPVYVADLALLATAATVQPVSPVSTAAA